MKKKIISCLLIGQLFLLTLTGCSAVKKELESNDADSKNVIITETGDVIETEPIPEPTATPKTVISAGNKEKPTLTLEDGTEISEPDIDVPAESKEHEVQDEDNQLQLVFLGDSIFDFNRDGTGVPYLTARKCNASMYNLAVAGTSASLNDTQLDSIENWSSDGLCGVVYAMLGTIPTDVFVNTNAKAVLDDPNVDFSKTDYFIVEYGLNDFLKGTPQSFEEGMDKHTYSGAMQSGLGKLEDVAPDATIIVCTPHYVQFFNADGFMIGDGHVTNNGYGTVYDYKGTCQYAANAVGALCFNAFDDLGINSYTAEEYLEDGIHLTEAGRELYSDKLAELIQQHEQNKNN